MPTIFEYQYINYKDSIVGILIMLALNNINYKASIIGILIKVGFSQKVMAKISNFSNRHSCEPKIVPVQLIPVNDNKIILAIL